MSGSNAKIVSEINLDEFERRLRAAGAPPAGAEDPLSELTRLVNTIAAEPAKRVKVVDIASARMPRAERFAPAPDPTPAPVAPPVVEPQAAPIPEYHAEESAAPELRSSLDDVTMEPAAELGLGAAEPLTAGEPPETAQFERADSGSRRSWAFKVGALSALGLLMVAGAAAMKLGVPGLPKTPPMILAADGPSKIAPPSEAAVQSPGDSGALLLKDSATPAPVKIVTNEEQPVDLHATTQVVAPPQPVVAHAPDPSPVAPSVNTPVVAPSQSLGVATAPPVALFPQAKRVKTVSVRPDGTVISVDSAPAAAATPAPVSPPPAPVKVADASANAAAVQPATPKLDLPTKLSPKSSARVAIAKTDTTVSTGAAASPNSPLQLGSAPVGDKPVKPAKVVKPKAAEVVANADPAAVSDTAVAAAPASAGGGDWAVQLAAPRSESEAQGAISRLKSKYSGDLGGAEIGVHKAEVNGSTIYRVRASGLSKSDAAALCGKIKASGGDCFLARN